MSPSEIFTRLHDGFVDGIHLLNDKAVRLTLRDVGGRTYVMELIGVERLPCNDFREGNIISSISATTGAPPDRQVLKLLLGAPAPSVNEMPRQRHTEWIEREINRIAEGTMTLVSIVPSYGCDLVMLCKSVEIKPV